MNVLVERPKRVGFSTDEALLKRAKEVMNASGLSVSRALDLFVRQVGMTGELPLVDEAELLFLQLQSEIKQSIDDVEAGVKTYTVEEVRAELGL